jgi:hypothetical protein
LDAEDINKIMAGDKESPKEEAEAAQS